jgi:hypothetical protein
MYIHVNEDFMGSDAACFYRRWHPDRNPGDKKEKAEKKFKEVSLLRLHACRACISSPDALSRTIWTD